MQVALPYTIFAVLATIINLGSQETVAQLYQGPYALWAAIFVGTGTGLVTKYVLDKKYIFKVSADSVQQDTFVFILYTAMGIFTTAIFWGTEWLFDYLYEDRMMRYVGACIGLFVGYVTKYFLDKKYVFHHLEAK